MIDQKLMQHLRDKIQDDKFTAVDIPSYLTLFCQIGNNVEDIQQEVEDWDCHVALVFADLGSHWLTVSSGRFTCGSGPLDQADLRLSMTAIDATRIFAGREDSQSAFMSGALRVEGELPDAIKLRDVIEMVIEEIDY